MKALICSLVTCALFVTTAPALAQEPPPAPSQPAAAAAPAVAPPPAGRQQPQIPLEIQVVISRYQGEKRLSSLPYVLAVNANAGATQLNMGAEVPVPTTMFQGGDAKGAPGALRSFNYRNLGTSIECSAVPSATPSAFDLTLNLDETSVGSRGETTTADAAPTEAPVFRNFRSRTRLTLRDGQTRQYTAATDRVSGETTRLEVTLRVVK